MDIEINAGDIRIDTFCPKPSGFGLNKQNGVRITHLPTGYIVECSMRINVHLNRKAAMDELRLYLKNKPAAKPQGKHTPTPWTAGTMRVKDSSGVAVNHHCVGKLDTTLAIALTGIVDGDMDEQSAVDAKRIEVCVNACAGIVNENLEDDCITKTRQDRDGLLIDKTCLIRDLVNVTSELKQLHAHHYSFCNGGCPADTFVNDAIATLKRMGVEL